MRLFLPKPYMYAFEWPERLEPSTTKSFFSGNLSVLASSSMPVRRGPSSSGEYLLKSGAMRVGYTVITTSCRQTRKAQR